MRHALHPWFGPPQRMLVPPLATRRTSRRNCVGFRPKPLRANPRSTALVGREAYYARVAVSAVRAHAGPSSREGCGGGGSLMSGLGRCAAARRPHQPVGGNRCTAGGAGRVLDRGAGAGQECGPCQWRAWRRSVSRGTDADRPACGRRGHCRAGARPRRCTASASENGGGPVGLLT